MIQTFRHPDIVNFYISREIVYFRMFKFSQNIKCTFLKVAKCVTLFCFSLDVCTYALCLKLHKKYHNIAIEASYVYIWVDKMPKMLFQQIKVYDGLYFVTFAFLKTENILLACNVKSLKFYVLAIKCNDWWSMVHLDFKEYFCQTLKIERCLHTITQCLKITQNSYMNYQNVQLKIDPSAIFTYILLKYGY